MLLQLATERMDEEKVVKYRAIAIREDLRRLHNNGKEDEERRGLLNIRTKH